MISKRAFAFVGLALLAMSQAAFAEAQRVVGATLIMPTQRYPHGVLGDAIEYGGVELTFSGGNTRTIVLPEDRVFESTGPRLIDITGDGDVVAMIVESHQQKGARLSLYNQDGLLAATPYIGTRFRWLAPIGGSDLDGDGYIELAYIDRPHLAKTLRVWRFKDGALEPVANLGGLTNHRIGESDIGGGIRDCGAGPEMITASANWRFIMATTLKDGSLETRQIGPHNDRSSFEKAMNCEF